MDFSDLARLVGQAESTLKVPVSLRITRPQQRDSYLLEILCPVRYLAADNSFIDIILWQFSCWLKPEDVTEIFVRTKIRALELTLTERLRIAHDSKSLTTEAWAVQFDGDRCDIPSRVVEFDHFEFLRPWR